MTLLVSPKARAPTGPELVNPVFRAFHPVFRAFHSVKGAAAYLLHEPMKTLSHKAESVLGEVREGKIELTAAVAEMLITTVGRLREMADDVDRRLDISWASSSRLSFAQ